MQQTRGNMRTVQAGQGQQIAGAHQQIAAGEPVAAIGIGRGAHEGQYCRTGQQVDRRPAAASRSSCRFVIGRPRSRRQRPKGETSISGQRRHKRR